MATIPCQLSEDHTGVWACECANSGVFCSLCILDHMGSAAQPHSVKPLGQIGQYVCGMCHGQPVNPIRFKYDVCFCKTCSDKLTITSAAGQRSAPHALDEAALKERSAEYDAKLRADLSSEESQKRRGEAPRTTLQRLIADKRDDIQQNLRRAYDNMNSLEEIIQEALNLEIQLTESRAEVQSLQKRLAEGGGIQVGSMAGLKEVVERVENVSRENGDLRSLNNALAAKMAGLKAKLQAAEQELAALKERPPVDDARMKEVLKKQLDEAVALLQESILEQSQESAKVAAQKVTDVMPLVANLDLDNEWLDRESLEKLLHIASLSIEGFVDSESMREVSKVCVRVAKLLPRSRLTSVFADAVGKRLKTKREEGLKLVRAVQAVYEKTQGPRGKDVMEGLLRVLEKDAIAFEDSVSIVSHLAKLLNLQELCEIAADTTAVFEQARPDNEERKEFLLSLPVEWSAQHRDAAQQCVMELLRASKPGNFDRSFLLLARLLHSARGIEPSALFALTSKLAKLVPNAQLQILITQLSSFLEVAQKSPNAAMRMEAGLVTLKHLLKDRNAAPQEIQQLAVLLDALKTKDALIGLLTSLTTTLKDLRADTASGLGFATLNWALPGGQLRANMNFGSWLLEALAQSDRRVLEETAKNVTTLFSSLVQTQADELESTMRVLVNKNHSLQKVCSLASVVLSTFDATNSKYVSQMLLQLASNSTQPVVSEWVERTEVMSRPKKDLVLKSYYVYGELIRRKTKQADAATLGKEFLATFQEVADPAPLRAMLDAALQLLKSDQVQHANVTRICGFWSLMHRLLPTDPRIYALSSFFLAKVPSANYADISAVIDSLEQTLNVGNGVFASIVFKLAEIYMESIDESPALSRRFVDRSLDSLRGMQALGQASKASLEALMQKTRNQLRDPRDARDANLRFLEGSFHLCQLRKQEIDTWLTSLSQILDRQETLELVKFMRQIENLERYIDILALARPDPNVTNALSKLSELTVYLERRGIDVPKTTTEVSNALISRPTELVSMLDSISALITKSTYFNHFRLAYQLLQELSVRSKELFPLLKFVCETAVRLLDAGVAPPVVLKFCEVVFGGLNNAGSLAMLERLRAEGGNALQKLVTMLNREREGVTLGSIEQVIPAPPPPPPPQPAGQPQELTDIQAGGIRFFNFQNRTWNAAVPLSSQIQVTQYSSWTFLDGNRLFCCGGTAGTYKEAYILTRGNPNWTVAQQPNMITARYSHGIIYLEEFDTVFVFGGSAAGYVKQCEKFNLKQPQAWQALPDMQQARKCFNPAYYRDVIYLCGYCGNGSRIMEAFSPRSNTFVQINISIPEQKVYCCLYVDDDKLVVHSFQYILKYSLNPANQLTEASCVQTPKVGKYQNSQPILDKAQRLVFMSSENKCLVFNMDTGVQVAQIA